jgi:hypothetical protein
MSSVNRAYVGVAQASWTVFTRTWPIQSRWKLTSTTALATTGLPSR